MNFIKNNKNSILVFFAGCFSVLAFAPFNRSYVIVLSLLLLFLVVNNFDIKMSKLDIDISKADLKSARADLYPTLYTQVNAEYNNGLGNPANISRLMDITKKNDLWFIEDNCDALGSKYNDKYTGPYGHISTFSFYPAHHITMG